VSRNNHSPQSSSYKNSSSKISSSGKNSPRDSSRQYFLGSLALVGLVGVSYAVVANGAFVFDDYAVTELPATASLRAAFFEGSLMRRLAQFSFALSRHFFGQAAWAWHVPSIVLHAAAAVVLWGWLRQIGSGAWGRWTAWAGAMLFALHPIQTQAVSYVYQRSTVLAVLFILLALNFHARWRRSGRAVFFWPLAASCFLAFISKENSAVLPIFLAAQEWLWPRFGAGSDDNCTGGKRVHGARWLRLGFIVFLIVLEFGALSAAAIHAGGILRLYPTPGDYDEIPWILAALTQMKVWGLYFLRWVWPFYQNADPDVRIVKGIWDGWAWAGVMWVGALSTLAAALIRKSALTAFGILLFLIPILPELLTIRDPMFEHRMYLCVPGLILMTLSASRLIRVLRIRMSPKTAVMSVLAVTLLLTGLTVRRNQVWKTDLAFWTDAAAKSPLKPRAHLNLGATYDRLGNLDAASREFWKVYRMGPASARVKALSNLGMIEIRKGRLLEGLRLCRGAMKASPAYGRHYFLMGWAFEDLHKYKSALFYYMLASRKGPSDLEFQWQALNNRSNLLMRFGRYREARTDLRRGFAFNPTAPELLYNLGVLEELEGHLEEARRAYQRAAQQGHPEAIKRIRQMPR
jgi:tetratricopeptide (TPR) repeat protein